MKKTFLLLFLISITILGCKWHPIKTANSKQIVCTTTIVGDIVKRLVGSKYQVKILMGAGVDPHIYEAKPSDVRALGNASVIILNGLHLEGKMSDLFHRLRKEKTVIEFSNGMKPSKLIRLTSHSFDPHVWFDVDLWHQGIIHCKNQLQKEYPRDSLFFEENYLKLKKDLDHLDKEVRLKINDLPKSKRILITSHDAFHYFGKAYNVKVKALQGVSTVTEPGMRNVSNLVDFLVTEKIPAVFVESSVSPKAINAVIEACKSRGHNLKIGGMLYSDALGGGNSNADTYIKMIRKNTSTFCKSMNQ
jgi:manganese/zinc/iron transport system substrate-binding protein